MSNVTLRTKLFSSAKQGDLVSLRECLRHPDLDVNWMTILFRATALHMASLAGHTTVVSELLAHPYINVNRRTRSGNTAFRSACVHGHLVVVRLLLQDHCVDVNNPDFEGETPLKAVVLKRHDIVKWMIASGKHLDLGVEGDWSTDVVRTAVAHGEDGMVALLGGFKERPDRTRLQVRLELDAPEALVMQLFAIMVFYCDDFVVTRTLQQRGGGMHRFCEMVRKLPMELQMVLCHRAAGSGRTNIPARDANTASKDLAKKLYM